MATLTPTLTLSSPAGDIASDEVNFTVTDSLAISAGKKVITNGRIPTAASGSGVTVLDSSDYGKSYVYVRNIDSSITIEIIIGSTTLGTLASEEFGYFVWDGSSSLKALSASGTPVLEYAAFEA